MESRVASPWWQASRWLARGHAAVIVVLMVLCAVLIARSLLSDDPGVDPHGYAVVFGVIGLVMLLVVLLATVLTLVLLRQGSLAGPICQVLSGSALLLFGNAVDDGRRAFLGVFLVLAALELLVGIQALRSRPATRTPA